MAWVHHLDERIALDGSGRIGDDDATRQKRTASIILERFSNAPGQILADEVGMGKTFVALAAAASVSLHDQRPVVIMVPPAVLTKWRLDFSVFVNNCLPAPLRGKLNMAVADNGVEFLKLLDDPPERRKQVIFLAHGALGKNLSDGWVKLAIIQRAMKHRRNAEVQHRSMGRFAGKILMMDSYTRKDDSIWETLLDHHTSKWMRILNKKGFDEIDDDPVPEHVLQALEEPEIKPLLDELWEAIQAIPKRESSGLNQRLTRLRRELRKILPSIWTSCFLKARVQLPLLVLDEAHHLKNAGTRLASMFHSEEAEHDANAVSRGGQLAGVFERMLFLTATPFQLGHYELCNILDRFKGISWDSDNAPGGGQYHYQQKLEQLRELLDESQQQAYFLEKKWGQLGDENLMRNGHLYTHHDIDAWWEDIETGEGHSESIVIAQQAITLAADALSQANKALGQWVIRHTRPRELSSEHQQIPRRRKLAGQSVIDHDNNHNDCESQGLSIDEESALPFLLAARYVALTPGGRPVTSEGLASSYETFLETRSNLLEGNLGAELEDDVIEGVAKSDSETDWYLRQIKEAIKPGDRVLSELHPKIRPVVDRVVDLWLKGEKVLVFCHYIKTGRALRAHISHQIREKLYVQASKKLSCDKDVVAARLQNMGKRFKDGSGLHKRAEELINEQIKPFANLADCHDELVSVVHRFMRTPTFLVRYFEFAGSRVQPETLHKAFEYKEAYGLSFNELLANFFRFLSDRTDEERKSYLAALKSIQIGDISSNSDIEGEGEKDAVLATVRLVNGSVEQDARQHLMKTFNTPFYPEVLVASSVLSEGVDLHLNCRHIIHYDLSWNPSNLEQRTGRVDRIGAKAEKVGQPIYVYYPYLAGTQDEKMYRVVMDRDRWFNVVMGGSFKIDYETTEKLAERIPLPTQVLEKLKLDLTI
ncbi:MAG: hypothetical protein BMS9Abin36_1390 [Gammaproteobacteria bacterium]|nr:MAG: hypothetical protein BMS9Abin36_1390 [Gammaproteobacteria bacterium]